MLNRNKWIKYIIIALIWLIIWELASVILGNSILLVGPVDVIITLFGKVIELSFWKSIGTSLIRIGIGFFAGVIAGVSLGIVSYKWKIVEDFLMPPMAFIKAAPVASFVVLFLIWWHSNVLSIAICICVVMPQIYISLLQGLKSTDVKLLEMARVFRIHPMNRVNYIYRQTVRPYLEGAIKLSASMAWKSGVAAEVIGTPDSTIGEALYMSKIYLDTAGVLAWTLTIILISVLCEKAVLVLYGAYNSWMPKCLKAKEDSLLYRYASSSGTSTEGTDLSDKPGDKEVCYDDWDEKNAVAYGNMCEGKAATDIIIDNICKSYDSHKVLENFSATYSSGDMISYDWVSGAGKTTLLRILAGLEHWDSGVIHGLDGKSVAMTFQEDRLCEEYSAIINVAMVCGDSKRAEEVLLELLKPEDIIKPVSALSGGQKRRVAIARMLSAYADVLLIDEPYNGLDADTRALVAEEIAAASKGRICIMASHIAD